MISFPPPEILPRRAACSLFSVEYNHPTPEKQFIARGKFEKCPQMEYIFQQTADITAK